MITDKFKELVERKIDDLRQYKESNTFKQSVYDAKIREINILIDYHNSNDRFIQKLEFELSETAKEVINLRRLINDYKKGIMQQFNIVETDGKFVNKYNFGLDEISNKILTKPYGTN